MVNTITKPEDTRHTAEPKLLFMNEYKPKPQANWEWTNTWMLCQTNWRKRYISLGSLHIWTRRFTLWRWKIQTYFQVPIKLSIFTSTSRIRNKSVSPKHKWLRTHLPWHFAGSMDTGFDSGKDIVVHYQSFDRPQSGQSVGIIYSETI